MNGWTRIAVFMIVVSIAGGIGLSLGIYSLTQIQKTRNEVLADSIARNHRLFCLIDRLFGLDHPLTQRQLKSLRPSQRLALAEIVKACPELGRRSP